MNKLLPLAFLLLLVGCFGCETDIVTGDPVTDDPTGNDANPGTGGDQGSDNDPPADFPPHALEALRLVNQLRATGCTCGTTRMPPVGPLSLHPDLMTAARAHTDDQAARGQMGHAGSDGTRVGDRVNRTPYRWRTVGENVARGYFSTAAVIEGWQSSAGHCQNMMNADYVHMGFAERSLFYTQVLAAPRQQ